MDLISIIIPYFKKKKYIKSTLVSILNQSYKKFEILIIYDDPSNEDLEYLKNLIKIDTRIKLIENHKNIGAGLSRNKGLKFSRGNYICFIDADDIWKKNKLKKQIQFMQKNKYNFSFTSYSIINEKNEILGKRNVFFDANYKILYNSNIVGLSTVMINKTIKPLISFPNLRTQEDFALWLKLCKKGVELKHLKNNLSFWRKTKKSLSSNILNKIMDAFKLYYMYEKKNFIFSVYSVLVLSYNKLLNKRFK